METLAWEGVGWTDCWDLGLASSDGLAPSVGF